MTRTAKEQSMMNALRVIGCTCLLLAGAVSAHATVLGATVTATPTLIVPAASDGVRFGLSIANVGASQGNVPLAPPAVCSFILNATSTPALAEGAPGSFLVQAGSTWTAPISGSGYVTGNALWCVATPGFDLSTAPITVDVVQR